MLSGQLREGMTYAELLQLAAEECPHLSREYFLNRSQVLTLSDSSDSSINEQSFLLDNSQLDELYFELREIDFTAPDPEIERLMKEGLVKVQTPDLAKEVVFILGEQVFLLPREQIVTIAATLSSGLTYNNFGLSLAADFDLNQLKVVKLIPFNVDFADMPPLAFRLMSLIACSDRKNAVYHNETQVASVGLWMAFAVLMGFDRNWIKNAGSQMMKENYEKIRMGLLEQVDWLFAASEKEELNHNGNQAEEIFLEIIKLLSKPETLAILAKAKVSTEKLLVPAGKLSKVYTFAEQQKLARLYLQFRREILAVI